MRASRPGTYVAKQYTILNATGGLAAAHSARRQHQSAIRLQVEPELRRQQRAFSISDFALAQYRGLNVNQQNVANALTNFFNTTGGIPLVFGTLTPAGLTQVSGEIAAGSQQSTFNAMTQFMGVMTDPFTAGRGDGGAGASRVRGRGRCDERLCIHRPQALAGPSATPMRMITKAAPRAPAVRAALERVGGGLRRLADHRRQCRRSDRTPRPAASAASPSARITGCRRRPSPALRWPAAAPISASPNGGSGRSDLFQAGAFVRHNVGPAYITGALAYGWQDVTTDRTVTVAGHRSLRAQFNANAFSGRVEGGYRLSTPWMVARHHALRRRRR